MSNMDALNNIDLEVLPGSDRKSSDTKLRLGKKLNVMNSNEHLKQEIRLKGMKYVNVTAEWENIVTPIYANYSLPIAIKNISGTKTLLCKVLHTRTIEFQHEKENFIKKINLFANVELVQDIRFIRADRLPPRREKPVSMLKKIPKGPHLKFSQHTEQCQNETLKAELNKLAHLVLTPQETVKKVRKSSPMLNAWRERARILLNSPDK